ncbi:MAG: bifunctional metallophosphatase/5'-nucleotidase [Gammaproteobacteria bacterium]
MDFYKRFFHYFLLSLCIIFVPGVGYSEPSQSVLIKILGINDFHGQVTAGRKVGNHPVGSAAVLASYLKESQKQTQDGTIFTMMGDQFGASPPVSALLKDEPTILFLNSLGNSSCTPQNRLDPQCNMVATIGNHEFDKGQKHLFEVIYGRSTPPTDSWIPLSSYPGANFPFISSNIVNTKTGQLIFPPYVIKKIKGISIAFIGAILKDAPSVIMPRNIEGLKFLDEADAINHYIPEIKAQGVDAIVVLIHQGGFQQAYSGATQDATKVEGPIVDIVKRLNDNIDLVMAGHTHAFTNAFLENAHGKKILVTEAYSYSTSFAEVTLQIDKIHHRVEKETARIITAFADQAPGTTPDPEVAKLIKYAEVNVQPKVEAVVGTLQHDLTKMTNSAGESNLGHLVADSYKNSLHTDMAFSNPGGLRADLSAGKVTWGDLFSVMPFSNQLVKTELTGKDIYALLEQQWQPTRTNILIISGLSYVYDQQKPAGSHVVAAFCNGQPLVLDKMYTIGTNDFFLNGPDGFTVMKNAKLLDSGDLDIDALVNYVKNLPQPFTSEMDGRIKRLN